jgi:hypothetical protein
MQQYKNGTESGCLILLACSSVVFGTGKSIQSAKLHGRHGETVRTPIEITAFQYRVSQWSLSFVILIFDIGSTDYLS